MGAAKEIPFFSGNLIETLKRRLHRATDPGTTLTGKMDTGSPLDGH
jgi:hypothetical protein